MTSNVQIRRATAADMDGVLSLLRSHELPIDGLRDHVETTVIAFEGDRVVASAALEIYPDGALLRSVAVARELRGRGMGRDLTDAALQLAAECHVPAVYLLTTTAEEYFPRFGFERIPRADVPPSVQRSVEFQSACPSAATVMRKRL